MLRLKCTPVGFVLMWPPPQVVGGLITLFLIYIPLLCLATSSDPYRSSVLRENILFTHPYMQPVRPEP